MSSSSEQDGNMDSHVVQKCSFRSLSENSMLPSEDSKSDLQPPNKRSEAANASKLSPKTHVHQLSVSRRADSVQSKRVASAASAPSELTLPENGDKRWESMVQGLIEYKRKHSSLNIPRGYKWNNRNLYEFARNQRKHYLNGLRGKLPALLPKRIERLRSIGFELDPTGVHGQNDAFDAQRWVLMFQGLEEFYKKHGSFAVPCGYMCHNRSLHDWVRHQRKQYSTIMDGAPALSAERVNRLQSIGFELDPTGRRLDKRTEQERWQIMFEGLMDFKKRNNNFIIPDSFVHDNRFLASWAHNQRRLYANHLRNQAPTLQPDRIQRLLEIGFDLGPRRAIKHTLHRKRKRTEGATGRDAYGLSMGSIRSAASYSSDGVREPSAADWAQPLVEKAITKYQSLTEQERLKIVKSIHEDCAVR